MNLRTKQWVLLALMLLSVGLGAALAPTAYLSDELPAVDLQAMVPKAFGEWKELPVSMVQIVNPQQQETLEKIYSETLSRTYVNPLGYRIMLTIAYGKNQNKSLELHSPEVCYPAQGFALTGRMPTALNLSGRSVPATRIETHLGQRYEPVTFWSTIGSHVPSSTMQKRLVEFRYAVTGRIPDGFLVRLSSIDKETAGAYAIQTAFANDLLQAIAPRDRARFGGQAEATGAP
jgi:EpsI family protein